MKRCYKSESIQGSIRGKQPQSQDTVNGPTSVAGSQKHADKPDLKVKPYIPKRLRTQQERQKLSDTNISEKCTSSNNADYQNLNNDAFELNGCTQGIAKSRYCPRSKNFPPANENAVLKLHAKPIACIRCNEWKPDLFTCASLDSRVSIVSSSKRNVVKYLDCHSEGVKDARWTRDGAGILSGGFGMTAVLTDVETGQTLFNLHCKDYITTVQVHPEKGDLYLIGKSKSGIAAIDRRAGKVIQNYNAHIGEVQDLIFLPGGNTFLSAAEVQKRQCIDKAIISWDFATGAVLSNQIYQDPFNCTALRLHPNEKEVLVQSGAGYIALFSTVPPYKLNKYKRFEGHETAGYRIGFSVSPDGSLVATGDKSGRIFIYDHCSSKVKSCLHPASNSVVTDVTFHWTESTTLLSSSWDGELSIWN